MKSKLLAAIVLALIIAPASAQDAAGGENVALTIDFVSWSADLDGLQVTSGGGSEDITALAFRYSEPITYRGPRVLEISQSSSPALDEKRKREIEERRKAYQEEGLPVPEPPPPPTAAADASDQKLPPAIEAARKRNPAVVGMVNLPANSRRVTVLLAPGPAGTLTSHVIDDDPTRLPPDKVRIHNLSPHLVAFRVPEQPPKQLKARESFLATPKDGTLIYELAYEKDGKWKVQENNLISIDPGSQVQMVVLQSEADFFKSADGSRAGFLQTVILTRTE